MDEQPTAQSVDPLLFPFLSSTDGPEAEELLAKLIYDYAEPVIAAIVRKKLCVPLSPSQGSTQNQDGLDLSSDVRALLISELRSLKANSGRRAIGDFRQYVAVKTYSACADYFRSRHPRRRRLKNMLRYHLKRDSKFALWENHEGRWLCGLRAWPTETSCTPAHLQLQSTVMVSPGADLQNLPIADFLSEVFERAGAPLELDAVVRLATEVWSIKDEPPQSFDQHPTLVDRVADRQAPIDVAVEQHLHLEKLWTEVCALPALQRAALLLNLRDADGGSVIAFLPYLGIASKAEIAELVGIDYEEFANFWDDLPWEDLRIAQLLGITRQQVINLRKTGRERLARRMKALERKP